MGGKSSLNKQAEKAAMLSVGAGAHVNSSMKQYTYLCCEVVVTETGV